MQFLHLPTQFINKHEVYAYKVRTRIRIYKLGFRINSMGKYRGESISLAHEPSRCIIYSVSFVSVSTTEDTNFPLLYKVPISKMPRYFLASAIVSAVT